MMASMGAPKRGVAGTVLFPDRLEEPTLSIHVRQLFFEPPYTNPDSQLTFNSMLKPSGFMLGSISGAFHSLY